MAGLIHLLSKSFIVFLALGISFNSPVALAKKKDEKAKDPRSPTSKIETDNKEVASRISVLSPEDRRLFDSLSEDQKKSILKGKVDIGFNEWMIELAVGSPFYGTEHHPVFVDYEQVWLYTKPEVKNQVREEKILDSQNKNWPTIHRTTRTETCNIADYFLLFDRGVVEKIVPATERKVHGSCTIETTDAYLPIVDGKPVEIRK